MSTLAPITYPKLYSSDSSDWSDMEEAEELRKQFQQLIIEDEEKKTKMKFEAKQKKDKEDLEKNQTKSVSQASKGFKITTQEERLKQ